MIPVIVMVALLVTGASAIVGAAIRSADIGAGSFLAASENLGERFRSGLDVTGITYSGGYVEVTVRNAGSYTQHDWRMWDLWVAYDASPGGRTLKYAQYTATNPPSDDQWTLVGIYDDAAAAIVEVRQPGLLDPNEEAVLRAKLAPNAIDPGSNTIAVATFNGVVANAMFTWQTLASTPAAVKAGGSLTNDGSTYLYALRGNGKKDFWRYAVAAEMWDSLSSSPANVKQGGSLEYAVVDGAGYVFAFRGDDKTDFWRYAVDDEAWATVSNAPANVKEGGSLTWDGGDTVYALRGKDTKSFWAYSISTDQWTALADTPDKVKQGGAAVYLDGAIFVARGKRSVDFWKYDIGLGSWSTLADLPNTVEDGGSLATDGQYIYTLRGDFLTDFWRYDTDRARWNGPFPDTPLAVDQGGTLTFLNGTLFALRGDNTADFWSYDVPIYWR